jgi:hypothetical protein
MGGTGQLRRRRRPARGGKMIGVVGAEAMRPKLDVPVRHLRRLRRGSRLARRADDPGELDQ